VDVGDETAEAVWVAPDQRRATERGERQVEERQQAGDERAERHPEIAQREPDGAAGARSKALPEEYDEPREEQGNRLLVAEREPEHEHPEPQEPYAVGSPAPFEPDQEQQAREQVVEGEHLGDDRIRPEEGRERQQ